MQQPDLRLLYTAQGKLQSNSASWDIDPLSINSDCRFLLRSLAKWSAYDQQPWRICWPCRDAICCACQRITSSRWLPSLFLQLVFDGSSTLEVLIDMPIWQLVWSGSTISTTYSLGRSCSLLLRNATARSWDTCLQRCKQTIFHYILPNPERPFTLAVDCRVVFGKCHELLQLLPDTSQGGRGCWDTWPHHISCCRSDTQEAGSGNKTNGGSS